MPPAGYAKACPICKKPVGNLAAHIRYNHGPEDLGVDPLPEVGP